MNVVLYTEDMLPITVLDLSHGQLEFLKETGRMRIPVMRALTQVAPTSVPELAWGPVDVVDVWIEPLWRNGRRHWLMFTGYQFEELALEMPSTYLPGQRKQLNEDRKEAFARGILAALTGMLGRGDGDDE